MFDLVTCQFVVWGYKNTYHTHGHIHEAFFRTLSKLGYSVQWLDATEDISAIDFANTFFITNTDCINNSYWPWPNAIRSSIPLRDDCFYAIHGLNDVDVIRDIMDKYPNRLSWGVLTMDSLRKKEGLPYYVPLGTREDLDDDAPFYLQDKSLEFRWASDLMPDEIMANKPKEWLSLVHPVINYIGTRWRVNDQELGKFQRAAEEDGIKFNLMGGGTNGIVSQAENIRLVRESYMAPAILGTHHLSEGYAPCRIFKNISYGQMGITNSTAVNQLFGGRLIYDPDPYKLYHVAKEQLANLPISLLHNLMDEVARKHTYVNRINVMLKAAQLILV